MLSNLKERLLSVKKNVSIFVNSTEDAKKVEDGINEFSGGELLSKYQQQWVSIHSLNEENAKNANKVAKQINDISRKVKDDRENITLITHILTQTNFVGNITNCLKQVGQLYELCEQVERGLIMLEDCIEEKEIEKMKSQHSHLLDQYEKRKENALEEYQMQVEKEHNEKVVRFEASKKKSLEERQKVFQAAFKSDMEVYKNLGTIPKIDGVCNKPSALLEEIQLDFDQSELEQFFADNSNL